MEERIFDIIFKEDEVTWQSLIYNLVKAENMDPWDIDVSKLSFKYVEMLKKMHEMDFRVSGKVVLAAAILLKVKSNYLLNEDLLNFDKLMHPDEYTEDALYEEHKEKKLSFDPKDAKLIPKTPQPRKRKVSIYELVDALKQALEVKKRRREILDSINITAPEKRVDISVLIDNLYESIVKHLAKNDGLTYSQLTPEKKKEELVTVFLPLLHLSNSHKIDLEQQTHFGEIEVMLHDEAREITSSASHEQVDFKKKHDFIGDALSESEKSSRKKRR